MPKGNIRKGENKMKEWTISEFLEQCEELCWNPYTYDYSKMPEGVCNGHEVKPYMGSWHSIVIDGCICNMALYDEKRPNGTATFNYKGKNMTALEYVRARLEEPKKERKYDPRVYGYVNGNPCYSADEFVYKSRGFGAIETDEELMAFAKKASCDWYDSGWHHSFISFYLSDYALSEPCRSLTKREFERLKELQKAASEEYKKAEETREWKLVKTIYWADNSEEEVWEDKDGVQKTVMTVAPHGDACY